MYGSVSLRTCRSVDSIFKDDAKVQKVDRSITNVNKLRRGNKTKSLDMEYMENEAVFSRVVNATILNDSFTGHEMHFGNEIFFIATSPHYMIIFNKGNALMIQACKVKFGALNMKDFLHLPI